MAGFLAKAISIILHPLIIPTLIFTILAVFAPDILAPIGGNLFYFIAFIFATTYVFPALGIMILYISRIVSSLYLDLPKERLLAIGITLVVYSTTAYLMYTRLRVNDAVMILFISIIVAQLLAGIITISWKISLHSIAAGGFTYFLGFMLLHYEANDLFYPFIIGIVLCGGLMSARLYLNKHKPSQVWLGGLLGISVSFAASLLM